MLGVAMILAATMIVIGMATMLNGYFFVLWAILCHTELRPFVALTIRSLKEHSGDWEKTNMGPKIRHVKTNIIIWLSDTGWIHCSFVSPDIDEDILTHYERYSLYKAAKPILGGLDPNMQFIVKALAVSSKK